MKFFGCVICFCFDERVKRSCCPKCLATDFSMPIKLFSSRSIIPWCNFTHSPTNFSPLIFLEVGISLPITLLLIQAFLLLHLDWSYLPSAHHFINNFLLLNCEQGNEFKFADRRQSMPPIISTFLQLYEKWFYKKHFVS